MKRFLPVLLIFVLFFAACPGSDGEKEDLLVKTITWVDDGKGFIQFYTNDSQYFGYEFYCYGQNTNGPNTFQIEVKKMSGSERQAYGMIFCRSDDRHYDLSISLYGDYLIGKVTSKNNWEMIKDWEMSDKIKKGFNKTNTLRVDKNGSKFTVFINGSQVCEFTDSSINGTTIGCFADVGKQEDESFPNKPVDVRFKQTNASGRSVIAPEVMTQKEFSEKAPAGSKYLP